MGVWGLETVPEDESVLLPGRRSHVLPSSHVITSPLIVPGVAPALYPLLEAHVIRDPDKLADQPSAPEPDRAYVMVQPDWVITPLDQ